MKSENPVIKAIKMRRSIRRFTKGPVSEDLLNQILESGLWAPSGKNNQPRKFAVIRDSALMGSLASLTHYSSTIKNAPLCIAVFSGSLSGIRSNQGCAGRRRLHPEYASHPPFDGIGRSMVRRDLKKQREGRGTVGGEQGFRINGCRSLRPSK